LTATVRLKHLCSQWGEYGLGVSAEDYTAEGVRLIRTSDITDDGELAPAEGGVFVDPAVVNGLELRTGDVLISRSGTLGRSLIFDEGRHGKCTFAAYLVRFRLKDRFDPRFIYYFTKSSPFEQQIQLEATQATIANFNAQKLGSLELPDFSAERQVTIGDFLDREIARIERRVPSRHLSRWCHCWRGGRGSARKKRSVSGRSVP
jgi:type I restriction enzyme S subunit